MRSFFESASRQLLAAAVEIARQERLEVFGGCLESDVDGGNEIAAIGQSPGNPGGHAIATTDWVHNRSD